MNHKKRKLKQLLSEITLSYHEKHAGKHNAAQSLAQRDLKLVTSAFSAISMQDFVRDQKEYMQLTNGSDKIFETMIRLGEEGKIPSCTPTVIGDDYGQGTNYVHEQYCYILMEIYEGKHNEFLQQIIDKTNPQ